MFFSVFKMLFLAIFFDVFSTAAASVLAGWVLGLTSLYMTKMISDKQAFCH